MYLIVQSEEVFIELGRDKHFWFCDRLLVSAIEGLETHIKSDRRDLAKIRPGLEQKFRTQVD